MIAFWIITKKLFCEIFAKRRRSNIFYTSIIWERENICCFLWISLNERQKPKLNLPKCINTLMQERLLPMYFSLKSCETKNFSLSSSILNWTKEWLILNVNQFWACFIERLNQTMRSVIPCLSSHSQINFYLASFDHFNVNIEHSIVFMKFIHMGPTKSEWWSG